MNQQSSEQATTDITITEVKGYNRRQASKESQRESDADNPQLARAAKWYADSQQLLADSGVPRLIGTKHQVEAADLVRCWVLQTVGHSTAVTDVVYLRAGSPGDTGIPAAPPDCLRDYRVNAAWWLHLFGLMDFNTLVPAEARKIDEQVRSEWVIEQLVSRTEEAIEAEYQQIERRLGLLPVQWNDRSWAYSRVRRIDAAQLHPDSISLFKRASNSYQVKKLLKALDCIPAASQAEPAPAMNSRFGCAFFHIPFKTAWIAKLIRKVRRARVIAT